MTNKNVAIDNPVIVRVIPEVLECAVAEQEKKIYRLVIACSTYKPKALQT